MVQLGGGGSQVLNAAFRGQSRVEEAGTWPGSALALSQGNPSKEVALLSPLPRSMFAPGGTGTPFGIFSVCCLPTCTLTSTPSFILCAFLIWKQPNILGFLGHISFECSVPLLPPPGIWTWAWDVGGYSGKAEDSEGPGPGLGNFHQTQQEARAQQLVERS